MFANFFERTGRIFFQRMGLPFFLLLLCLGPIASSLYLFYEKQSAETFQAQFSTVMTKAKSAFEKKSKKESFLELHKNSDPYFIDKEIESISFLDLEKQRLKSWISHPAISNKDALWKRLRFIESDQNHLSFIEEEIQVSKSYKETVEKQRHPVEIDENDLKKLLTIIEEMPLDPTLSKTKRPQLVICDFSLNKKTTPLQNEVFELKMDLLKRKFQTP